MKPSHKTIKESALFEKLHPEKYIKQFFSNGIREDGRKFYENRNILISTNVVNSAYGSSLIKIGKTTVICTIDLNTEIPDFEKKNIGKIVLHTQLPKISSDEFYKRSVRDEYFYDVSDYVESQINKVINLEELIIEKGKCCFVVDIHASVLVYDGNLYDTFLLAVMVALKDLKIPGVDYIENEKRVDENLKKEMKRLKFEYFPISVSFGIVENQSVVDLTEKEEKVAQSKYSLIFNEKEELCSVYKGGGVVLKDSILKENMILGIKQSKFIYEKVNEILMNKEKMEKGGEIL